MRKHAAFGSRTSSAVMPVAGAVLAAAATVLLGGCTSSAASPTAQGASASATATASAAASAGAGSSATATAAANGTGTAAGSGTSTGGVQSAPTCTGSQLSLSTSPDSAGGLYDYIVVSFVNQGSAACTVKGYPGAAARGVTSSTYVINATRELAGSVGDTYSAPVPITLAPGATASTILEWIDKPTPGHPDAYCLRSGSGCFGVTAPNTTQTLSVALPSDVCSGLLVHPLVAGSTGRETA